MNAAGAAGGGLVRIDMARVYCDNIRALGTWYGVQPDGTPTSLYINGMLTYPSRASNIVAGSLIALNYDSVNGYPQVSLGGAPDNRAYGGLWFGTGVPDSGNFTMLGDGALAVVNAPDAGSPLDLRTGNGTRLRIQNNGGWVNFTMFSPNDVILACATGDFYIDSQVNGHDVRIRTNKGAGVVDVFKVCSNGAVELVPFNGTPGSLADGMIWYDSSANAIKCRINGATKTVTVS